MNKRKTKKNVVAQNGERSKYDNDQALAMKGAALSNTKNSNKNTKEEIKNKRSLFKASTYSDEKTKVNASLRGLDEAEELADKGKLSEARAAYERHIGYLIDTLNKMKASDDFSSSVGISSDVLRERARAALTDAEQVKERIIMSGNGSGNDNDESEGVEVVMTGKGEENEATGASSLFKFGRSKSAKEVVRQKKPMQDPYKIKTSKSTDASRSKSRSKSRPKPKRATAATTTITASSQPRKKSNLNYKNNDPFITTIKNDIYVDSSRLTTTWKDIAGLVDAKRALQEAAILPLIRPDLYTGLRSPPKGILLYGPPGTGKTMLVKAVAHESQCILFACSASAMTSKWVGEGEKLVRTLFRMAADVAPSIVFLDEIDSLLGRRKSDGNNEGEGSRRFKTEFMVQMDGIAAGGGGGDESKKVLVIGATNCPWDIDDAIMRRFNRRVYVPLPDKDARLGLWNNMISKSNGSIKVSKREVNELVKMTDGFSCSDIASMASEASFGPLRDLGDIDAIKDADSSDIRDIMFKDFKSAILSTKKSVSMDLLQKYKKWEDEQSIS